jgi:hypothetical protein
MKANLPHHFDSLVLMGCSGGAIGVQFWARHLLRSLSYSHAAVVADSFVTVLPEGAQHKLLQAYGVCSSGLLNDDQVALCKHRKLTIHQVFDSTIAEFPHVTFVSINSKGDASQIHYYNLIGKIFHGDPPKIDANLFYHMANDILTVYNKHPNFVSFWADGAQHCFTPFSLLYQVTAAGGAAGVAVGGLPEAPLPELEAPLAELTPGAPVFPHVEVKYTNTTISNWLANLPVRPGHPLSSQCSGQLLSKQNWPWNQTDYCDDTQIGKTMMISTTTTVTPVVVGHVLAKSSDNASAKPSGTSVFKTAINAHGPLFWAIVIGGSGAILCGCATVVIAWRMYARGESSSDDDEDDEEYVSESELSRVARSSGGIQRSYETEQSFWPVRAY